MMKKNNGECEIIALFPRDAICWKMWGNILREKLPGLKVGLVDPPFLEDDRIDAESLNGGKERISVDHGFSGVLIIPLFVKAGLVIVPFGLDVMEVLRTRIQNYRCTPLFLVPDDIDIPPYRDSPSFISSFAKRIVGNPEFGYTRKAVFFAERREFSVQKKDFMNIIALAGENPPSAIKEFCENFQAFPKTLLQEFYNTFVSYYEPFGEINKQGDFAIEMEEFLKNLPPNISGAAVTDSAGHQVKPGLELANRIYNRLHGNAEEDTHSVNLELFRAPIPFPLQDLIDAREEIKTIASGKANKHRRIRLLLIDNKSNKFVENAGLTLFDALATFFPEFEDVFTLEMLGGKSPSDGRLIKRYEKFHLTKFIDENCALNDQEEDYHKSFLEQDNADVNRYRDLVYRKIRSSHFILLDFFLNKEDTYLAYDFIQDIQDITDKETEKKESPLVVWYFITSAVYDSVVKYAQSGLLAEHYESAVVNAGDDPTNERRQIIFVYKLLTFIRARIRYFKRHKDVIEKRLLNKKGQCSECEKGNPCERIKCLDRMLDSIRKFQNEYDSIYDIFYSEEFKRDIKRVFEGLENIIKQFMWIPEADWPIIQRQIDFIDTLAEKIPDFKEGQRQFSCKNINDEMKKRSEIY
jgi:hypothetical protein